MLTRALARVARRVASYLVLAGQFTWLYWRYVAAALAGASLAWLLAGAASDYTRGGWEFHLEQRAWGLDLHFHHWYYGVPLLGVAVAILDSSPVTSVFVFIFGQALSAHSYHNEGGIPSLFEGGHTLAVPAFVYWPAASLLAALFTFFVVRSHEWLAVRASSEEASVSFTATRDACVLAFDALTAWARSEFEREKTSASSSGDRSASFSRLEENIRGIWELHCASREIDDDECLVTVRIRHMALTRNPQRMLAFLGQANECVRPFAEPLFSAEARPIRE